MTEKLIPVSGVEVDSKTKCKHYRSQKDIIAIKFKCCNTYYPCYECHDDIADHDPIIWSKNEWNTKAVLCGECKNELSILQYMNCQSVCPHCRASFNPRCQNHYHLYFEG